MKMAGVFKHLFVAAVWLSLAQSCLGFVSGGNKVTVSKLTSSLSMVGDQSLAQGRKEFLQQASLFTAGLLALDSRQVLADSTGKYSTKATARKRYLPRISKGLATFKALNDAIQKGDFGPIAAFVGEPSEDLISAMSLFASSTKKSELPDAASKARMKEAEDLGKTLKKLRDLKDLKGKKAEAAAGLYAASEALVASFLEKLDLPPLAEAGGEWYTPQ
mmetsp:Transcript_10881/g.20965  ORF Transcript_10881/g.20965 Transcript_10881/m.20965 type:complete len:218 (-) Transcript_10881:49-702(-)